MELTATERDYVSGGCLTSLLTARVDGEGWFMAAPGYAPYGNYVWHRDNAECIMALDEYAATLGEERLFETTAKAILRSFLYFESKQKGVDKLCGIKVKLTNPEFYDSSNHPHARLGGDGQELPGPWNNIQYDSVARMVVALAKHLSLTGDARLLERCKGGLAVALRYLTEAIWDQSGPQKSLTVCANEWEEKDEPHLRGPLFSSVLGLLYASGKYSRSVLQEYVDFRGLDLEGYEKQTQSMLKGFFVRDGVIRMIKRFDESPMGVCSTALWLLTSYEAFPPGGEVFDKTLDSLMRNRNLGVPLWSIDGASSGGPGSGGGRGSVVALRRYELSRPEKPSDGGSARDGSGHVDTYWGGQAWIITTAQLSTALAMRGDPAKAMELLSICLETRSAEGTLPEQFEGTYHDRGYHEKWREWSKARTPAPWLAWSHAEVIRAYAAIHRAS